MTAKCALFARCIVLLASLVPAWFSAGSAQAKTTTIEVAHLPDSMVYFTAHAGSDAGVLEKFYEPLCLTENDSFQPSLAKSYEAIDGGKSLVFTLDDRVRFWNGQALTGADVVATIAAIQSEESHSGPYRLKYESLSAAQAQGSSKVILTFAKPNPRALALACSLRVMSAPTLKKLMAMDPTLYNHAFGQEVNGTGPYKPAYALTPTMTKLLLIKHKDYWRPRTEQRQNTKEAALPASDVIEVSLTPQARLKPAEAPADVRLVFWNHLTQPGSALAVRKAMAVLLDRSLFKKAQGREIWYAAKGFFDRQETVTAPSAQAALALLTAAGWTFDQTSKTLVKDGQPLVIHVVYTDEAKPFFEAGLRAWQEQARAIGIAVKLGSSPWKEQAGTLASGQFDAFVGALRHNGTAENTLYTLLRTAAAGHESINFLHYHSSALDQALDDALRPASSVARHTYLERLGAVLEAEQPISVLGLKF